MQQAAGSRQQAAGSRRQAVGGRQQAAGSTQQAARSRQQLEAKSKGLAPPSSIVLYTHELEVEDAGGIALGERPEVSLNDRRLALNFDGRDTSSLGCLLSTFAALMLEKRLSVDPQQRGHNERHAIPT